MLPYILYYICNNTFISFLLNPLENTGTAAAIGGREHAAETSGQDLRSNG